MNGRCWEVGEKEGLGEGKSRGQVMTGWYFNLLPGEKDSFLKLHLCDQLACVGGSLLGNRITYCGAHRSGKGHDYDPLESYRCIITP
jgi:hypothetical protein